MKKINRKISALLLVVVFVFAPISFSSIRALSQSANVENITGYQEWNQSRSIDKNVIVASGATLVILKFPKAQL